MSVFNDMEQRANEVSQLLDKLIEMDNSDLYGESRLGSVSFKKHGEECFKKVFSLLKDFKKCNLTRIPVASLDPCYGPSKYIYRNF